ncbi:DNA polymerase III subunit alpha [bacterium]|nr:MAG: DNA polymerase III subunit alpha [bacterium]
MRRVLSPTGKVADRIRESASLGDELARIPKAPLVEDHTVDLDLRFKKARDEKVRLAMGMAEERNFPKASRPRTTFALLHAVSGYAFGRGAMLAEEIPAIAAAQGASAALLADPFSLAGAVEFSRSAAEVGIKPLIGATVVLPEGGELVLVARNQIGYRSLSRLISECHMGEPRLFPLTTWERLERHSEGLLCLTGGDVGPLTRLIPRGKQDEVRRLLSRLVGLYGRDGVVVEIERCFLPWERSINDHLLHLAAEMRLLACAGGLVTHGTRSHFPAQDVIACIHSLCGIEEVKGRKPTRDRAQPQAIDTPARGLNAERFIRSIKEMERLFSDRPGLLSNTLLVAERCESEVLPGRVALPKLYEDEGAALREATYLGAARRYGSLNKGHLRRLERELGIISDQNFCGHFLIAHEMCRWATDQGIQLSGRGSVVDSMVAYCLGLSRIDAFKHRLSFERFLPPGGEKRPDIDIDFQANRRDEVRDYLIKRFRPENVATVGAYGAFSTRGIIREVGKVMGLPPESIAFLSKKVHGGVSPAALEDALDKRPELRDSGVPKERFRWVFRLAQRLTDVPRNVRTHPSGVVVSAVPIADVVPVMHSAVEGVDIIQWDKRSAKRSFDKFDVLCLRALDILSHGQERIRVKDPSYTADSVPVDDPETFRTMRSGDLIGITQSASPAMTAAHVRIRTNSLADAALVQACIRPGVGGAIKNDLLVARKHGEPFAFEHPYLQRILGKTYGVVVFQEQVDLILVDFCGYSPAEAEEIREGIYKRRRENFVQQVEAEIKERVLENGFGERMAEVVYDLVAPYQGYGFAEGHALAFAETTIRSLWTKIHHPAEFFAAALEAQPAGYYPSHTLANEARNKGVRILAPCVNASELGYSVEDVTADADPKMVIPNGGIRVPLTCVSGVSLELCKRAFLERQRGLYSSLAEFAARNLPAEDELTQLVMAGAFDALHSNRRGALWTVSEVLEYARAMRAVKDSLPIEVSPPLPPTDVADFPRAERSLIERELLGLDVEFHLMAFERERVRAKGARTTQEARNLPTGAMVMVVGNPMRLRMPPTKSGRRVVFFDLEDETGLLNVTVFDEVYLRDGHAFITKPYVVVWAQVQDRMGHKAFLAHRIIAYSPRFSDQPMKREIPLVTADFLHA